MNKTQENVGIVERERERERESYNLKDKDIAYLAYKLYIKYRELKINMLFIHRQTVF